MIAMYICMYVHTLYVCLVKCGGRLSVRAVTLMWGVFVCTFDWLEAGMHNSTSCACGSVCNVHA